VCGAIRSRQGRGNFNPKWDKQFTPISICLVEWIDFEAVGYCDANVVSCVDKYYLGKQMGLINKLA
jgi:hypothetical protein